MFLFFPLHFSLFCMSESIVNSFCFAEHHHHHHHHDRHRYSVILSEQWVEVFSDIFAEDNYTPIFCDKPEDYTLITTQFPYKDNVLEMVRTMSHQMQYVLLFVVGAMSHQIQHYCFMSHQIQHVLLPCGRDHVTLGVAHIVLCGKGHVTLNIPYVVSLCYGPCYIRYSMYSYLW